MSQIDLQPEDTLYILGDVVDRYPFGVEILQKIMSMPNVIMLKGNHEVMFEYSVKTGKLGLWYYNGGDCTYDAYKKLPEEQQKEIMKSPNYIKLSVGRSIIRYIDIYSKQKLYGGSSNDS